MSKKHSYEPAESAGRTTRLSNELGNEEICVALLDAHGIARGKLVRAAPADSDKFRFAPGPVASDRNRSPQHGAWSRLFTFLMEGFALYGAALHPAAAFRVEAILAQEETAPQRKLSSRERRGSISLISPSTSPEPTAAKHDANYLSEASIEFEAVHALDTGRLGPWNWLTSPWQTVLALWIRRRRHREIKQAVAALAELDDRTLRDIGIPHRSLIEQAVRYCRDY